MSAGEVLHHHERGITTLTLSRPKRRNAVSAAFWERLRERLIEAADKPPRVLVITGTEGHFSAGLDIKPDNPLLARVLPIVHGKDADGARALVQELKFVCDLLASFPAPTIAAIEGACIGIGLELALACDLRVAARDARLALPELRLGLVPDLGGTVRLARLVGTGRAALLTLACHSWDGEEAWHHGLIETLCEPGRALERALTLAGDIRASAPTGTRDVLRVLRAVQDLDLDDALTLETEAGVNALLSGEPMEGLMARQMRREPAWNG